MAKSNIFQTVQTARPRRSVFDLSHEKKMTADMGKFTLSFVKSACLAINGQ